jgi:hypothetical protein
MVSFYSVVQYVPDSMADERINFGLIVLSESRIVDCRFLVAWKRVHEFAHRQDISFLQEFAARFKQAASANQLPLLSQPLDSSYLRQIAGQSLVEKKASSPSSRGPLRNHLLLAPPAGPVVSKWNHVIQFTPPRASTLPPQKLMTVMAPRVLKEDRIAEERPKGKKDAVRTARRFLQAAFSRQLGSDASDWIRKDEEVMGRLEYHKFDLCVRPDEGPATAAAEAISFDGIESVILKSKVDSIVYSLSDVKEQNPAITLSVFALHPSKKSLQFDRLCSMADKLKVDLVTEKMADAWAATVALRSKEILERGPQGRLIR